MQHPFDLFQRFTPLAILLFSLAGIAIRKVDPKQDKPGGEDGEKKSHS